MKPTKFKIGAYPNPFNAQITLKLHLDAPERLTLRILDIQGRERATLAQSEFQAGDYTFQWNGEDSDGIPVNSGVYLFQVIGQQSAAVYKITVIK